MLLQLSDVPHWFLINMFLHVGFSRYLQVIGVVFMQPRVNGAYYCDVLLLKQLLPEISSCWQLLLSGATRVYKSTELL